MTTPRERLNLVNLILEFVVLAMLLAWLVARSWA